MKVKRLKHVRRVLKFYRNNYDFLPPYKVMIDGTMCKAALNFQVNIAEQLHHYLESDVEICTTACVMAECEALGTLLYGPLKVLRQYKVEPCHHDPVKLATDCMYRMARQHKYFIGTQDQTLSENIRKRAGIPLIYISHKTLNLEAPSATSCKKAQEAIDSKMKEHGQHNIVSNLKKELFGEPEEPKHKKRKGPKGKNPLSCLKSKKRKHSATTVKDIDKDKPKRKRKRHNRSKVKLNVQ
ncbi:unnamed protein product [Owenia fusiformis]|uniref:rRNA-processing protein UTP23 homolog n=1 Tax=Owenia fusiformis TaxID=6347 RepID=A0A8S4N1V3_OWEFU|nr:unnamed protein product [Owenia fusiformis]